MRMVPICFLAALLAGCQTGDDALTTSATPAAVTGQAASAIAGDMASRFAEQIGSPETTTIHLDVDLAYSIDAFEGQILSRLTAPSIAIARAYTKTAAGATPASPLSVMRRN